MVERGVGGKKLCGDGFERRLKDGTQKVKIIMNTSPEVENYRLFFFWGWGE